METEAPHILVVDDDKRLRALLHKYLTEQGFRVTAASNGGDARARMAALEFDMLVLDVMMPGETGLELTRALREDSAVPVLLLTARGEAEDRIAGLESGADDYLTKPFEPRELVLRINAILRRTQEPEGPEMGKINFGAYEFDLDREELTKAGRYVRLTAAEASLLKALARRARQSVDRETLSAESPMSGSGRAVDVQVTRLRRKIEEDPKFPRYVRAVRGVGYVFMPD
jgi:two-component system phosphate regulon response regulator OmpR